MRSQEGQSQRKCCDDRGVKSLERGGPEIRETGHLAKLDAAGAVPPGVRGGTCAAGAAPSAAGLPWAPTSSAWSDEARGVASSRCFIGFLLAVAAAVDYDGRMRKLR